ncbi:MAG: DUF3987 domain-containing protein [Paracoccaceae bacterium]|nr:DUF3987 domain-containing protein [Paracoccaceae bacterium]
MVRVPPNETYSFAPEQQREAFDRQGFFWEQPKSDDEWASITENIARAREAQERMELRKQTGQSVAFEFRKPRDVLRKVAPPPFDFDDVSPPIGQFAKAFASATGFDQSGVIVASVTAAASVIDDRYKLTVRHESNWHVSARQWSFLCGGPSAGKSPAIRAASAHVKLMHGILHERWRSANEGKPRQDKDPAPALYTSDTTVPALSERLQGNPRGLLMLTEEFASWVGSIDSGDRGDAVKNRGDWLQLRDGGPHQIDRVERGSVFVPNWGVSVLAACTPDGLAKQLKHLPEDGLIQRFVPCILGAPDLDATGDASAAMTTWGQWLEWAYGATAQGFDTFIQFSSDARAMFDEEVRALRQLVIATEEFAPAYAAHLGKHPGMLAEAALVFHVFTATAEGELAPQVGVGAVAYAIRYMRKVRRHAYTLYSSILSTAPAFDLARSLARSIVAAETPMTTIGRADMSAMCAEFRKAPDMLRREAVQLLEDADWLEPTARSPYGGWPREYAVHQSVFSIFAREGEQWRARRAAVKDAIGEAR